MKREYHKWYSQNLEEEMELLIFGFAGSEILLFPTRAARFFDYENWKVIAALKQKIINGELQVFCMDSIDSESFFNFKIISSLCSISITVPKFRDH